MSCKSCKNVENNSGEWIRTTKYNLYECPICSQRYFCYNDHYRLWGKVDDDLTWKFLTHDVDVPIAIGDPCVVAPGYEEFAVEPIHKICPDRVAWPRVKIQPAVEGRKEIGVIQWTGNYKQGNIFRYQFAFPIMAPLEKFKDSISSFAVPFVGQIKDWLNEDQQEDLAKRFENPEKNKYVAYLLSAECSHDYGDGRKSPVSFVAEIVLLGDPNVGIIAPDYFYNHSMIRYVLDCFQDKNPI